MSIGAQKPFCIALWLSSEYVVTNNLFIEHFTQQCKKTISTPHSIQIYYDDQDIEKMQATTHHAVISLHARATEQAIAYMIKHEPTTPLICCGLTHLKKEISTHQLHTISIAGPSLGTYIEEFDLILKYIPGIHSVVLIEDREKTPSQKLQDTLHKYFERQNILVHTIQLHNSFSRQDVLHISRSNMAIICAQNPDPEIIHRLSILSKEHRTLLYTTHIPAVFQGAAFGFGLDEKILAQKAAEITKSVLATQIIPDDVMIPYSLKINLTAIQEQGSSIQALTPLLNLINIATVIEPTTHEKVKAYLRLEQLPLE